MINVDEITIVTAQPCELYFLWQLDIQLLNFFELGYKKKNIHVLISQPSEDELVVVLKNFMQRNKDYAYFFIYQDTRENFHYDSTIRPHLIKKHILSNGVISKMLYLDSDVIFKCKLQLEGMLDDSNNYVSDTKIYLNSKYVIRNTSEYALQELATIVGISVEDIVVNDINCGGAQYLLKNLDFEFWNKVEYDSEKIYLYLENQNLKKRENEILDKTSDKRRIQSWCADMWAVFYNLIYFAKSVKIANELAFCWPWEKIEKSTTKKIIHYSGDYDAERGSYFVKTLFRDRAPFFNFINLFQINTDNVSSIILAYIRKVEERLSKSRKKLDLTLIFDLRNITEIKPNNLINSLCYYQKSFDIKLVVYTKEEIPILKEYANYSSAFSYFYGSSEGLINLIKENNRILVAEEAVIFPTKFLEQLLKIEYNSNEFIEFILYAVNMNNFYSLGFGLFLDYEILNSLKNKIYSTVENLSVNLFNKESLQKYLDLGNIEECLVNRQIENKCQVFKFKNS